MQIAELYSEAQRSGHLRAVIFRASDFWGPELTGALLTRDALAGLKRGKRPILIGNPDAPHAFTHRDDVVRGLIKLAFAGDDVEGRVLHAPVIHVTQRELVQGYARALRVKVRPMVAPRWLVRLLGLFSKSTRGMVEMLPQWERPYLVDDSSYTKRFGVRAIALDEGVSSMVRPAQASS
jgi:nucleoside-diphosphate-sugar epimerase